MGSGGVWGVFLGGFGAFWGPPPITLAASGVGDFRFWGDFGVFLVWGCFGAIRGVWGIFGVILGRFRRVWGLRRFGEVFGVILGYFGVF